MAVGEIVPKFDGKFAADVNVHAAPGGIVFDKIGKFGRQRGDFAEAFQQMALVGGRKCAEKFVNFNGDEQSRFVHFSSGQVRARIVRA